MWFFVHVTDEMDALPTYTRKVTTPFLALPCLASRTLPIYLPLYLWIEENPFLLYCKVVAVASAKVTSVQIHNILGFGVQRIDRGLVKDLLLWA